MAKRSKQPTAEIQRLLDEKHQLEQWLERLSIAADETADHVRSKVGDDYSKRLEAVIEELHGYRDQVDQTLERHKEKWEDLVAREAQASEQLSEAELRHAVGEYDEAKWTQKHAEILEALVRIREELQVAQSEIASLEEVVGLAEGPGAEAEEAEAEAAEALTSRASLPEVDRPAADDLVADVPDKGDAEKEGAVADGGDAEGAVQTDAFDELEFLKSVGEGDESSPSRATGSRRRVSGPMNRVSGRVSGTAKKVSDEELAVTERRRKSQAIGADGVEQVGVDEDAPTKGRTTGKTLKCAECGTLNLPTEWYCESCGAELAEM